MTTPVDESPDITRRLAATGVTVRPLATDAQARDGTHGGGTQLDGARHAEDLAVRDLFDSTLLLGRPVERLPARYDDYREVCLGWYLDEGRRDAAIALVNGAVVGYALVCTDEGAASRWAASESSRLALRIAGDATRLRFDRASRAFYRGRLRDAVELARTRRHPPAPVHAHVNVAPGRRAGTVTVALLRHIDARSRAAGSTTWYGEINERAGARAGALRRLGLDVVAVDTNHTMTTLLGEPVQRLTVLRHVPELSSVRHVPDP